MPLTTLTRSNAKCCGEVIRPGVASPSSSRWLIVALLRPLLLLAVASACCWPASLPILVRDAVTCPWNVRRAIFPLYLAGAAGRYSLRAFPRHTPLLDLLFAAASVDVRPAERHADDTGRGVRALAASWREPSGRGTGGVRLRRKAASPRCYRHFSAMMRSKFTVPLGKWLCGQPLAWGSRGGSQNGTGRPAKPSFIENSPAASVRNNLGSADPDL